MLIYQRVEWNKISGVKHKFKNRLAVHSRRFFGADWGAVWTISLQFFLHLRWSDLPFFSELFGTVWEEFTEAWIGSSATKCERLSDITARFKWKSLGLSENIPQFYDFPEFKLPNMGVYIYNMYIYIDAIFNGQIQLDFRSKLGDLGLSIS